MLTRNPLIAALLGFAVFMFIAVALNATSAQPLSLFSWGCAGVAGGASAVAFYRRH